MYDCIIQTYYGCMFFLASIGKYFTPSLYLLPGATKDLSVEVSPQIGGRSGEGISGKKGGTFWNHVGETWSHFICNLFLLVFMGNMICNGMCSNDFSRIHT